MDSARRQELEHRELLEWQQYRGFLIMHGFMPPKHWDDESDATRQPTPWEDVPPCPACGAQAMRGGLNGTAAAWCPTPGCLDLTPLPVWLRLAASARLASAIEAIGAALEPDNALTIVFYPKTDREEQRYIVHYRREYPKGGHLFHGPTIEEPLIRLGGALGKKP